MDTRLIFRDFSIVRWEDGVLYTERIIGFAFVSEDAALVNPGSVSPSEA